MANDWTRSETTPPPNRIVVKYKGTGGDGKPTDKEVVLMSTTRSVSESDYQEIAYTDKDGKPQKTEVVWVKVDTTTTTIASVNQSYVAWRLGNGMGLPPGGAISRNVTTSEYNVTTEGPVLVRETTENYVSMAQFAGGLQIPDYTNFSPSGSEMVLTVRSIREIKALKSAEGRDITQTKTSRWIARGTNQEGAADFGVEYQAFKRFFKTKTSLLENLVRSYVDLIYEGTEVQVETGRMPVPSKPSGQDAAAHEVTNGSTNKADNPTDKYGNNNGWTKYLGFGDASGTTFDQVSASGAISQLPQTWEDFNKDSNNDGTPDWAPYVPQSAAEYNKDSNQDGIPDWAPKVPTGWSEFNKDSNNDGTPDWAAFAPTGWQAFSKDSNNDGIPNWAPYVPTGWQAFNKDSNADGTPDWAPLVPNPSNWSNYNKDSNNDGVPDWAPYVPQTWADWNKDSNGDGVPDWAPYVPQTWQDLNKDSNSDGEPDWAPYVPQTWQDYNQDSNGDGTADWEAYVPVGWQDFNKDSNGDGTPDWAPYVPVGNDFNTSASDYTGTGTDQNNDRIVTGVVLFDGQAYNADNITTTATYDMPYAPDDYFQYVKGIRKLILGGAINAATAFGRTEAALDIGHAYGQNIVTGWNEIPTLDLSPLYIQLEGVEGAFLADSMSYAWNADGMVVSSDLMLLGVTGYFGSSPPDASWLRIPVAVGGLHQVSAPAEGTAQKANSLPIPATFGQSSAADILALLPNTGADSWELTRNGLPLIPPTMVQEIEAMSSGPFVTLLEYPYALRLYETFDLFTSPWVECFGGVAIVNGTAAPMLGAGQVSPTSVATNSGWTLIIDDTADDAFYPAGDFGFAFTINGNAYTSCNVVSNGFIVFGGESTAYSGFSASFPPLDKLFLGAEDMSLQRVYTKAETGLFRIRWEGNDWYQAAAGSSNRFYEVTLCAPVGGLQYLEVRAGNLANNPPTGPFMLASATTSLASTSLTQNESYVFSGDASGNAWTVQSGVHLETT